MNSTTSPVGEINERAVELLQAGNFGEAVSHLDRALGYLMSTNPQNDDSSSSICCDESVSTKATYVMGNDDSWSCWDTSSSVKVADKYVECCTPVNNTEDITSQARLRKTTRSVPIPCCPSQRSADNIFEFYPKAIVLKEECCCPTGGLLCVVLFNMGLAYHREAIRLQQHPAAGESGSAYYYQTALNLYNLAQFHLHQAWTTLEDREDLKLILGLALSNNCGHIHAHQLNFKETQYSLEAVRFFVHSLLPDDDEHVSCQTDSRRLLSRSDYAFFSRTSIIFEDNNLGIAPSA